MDHGNHQTLWKVVGMTCSSCEKRVEGALSVIPGVLSAKADQSRGVVSIVWNPELTTSENLTREAHRALGDLGYRLAGTGSQAVPQSLPTVLLVGTIMIAVFLLMNSQGWFNFLPKIDSSVGLGMVFVAGLLTSLHCVAMCGGIALSQQTRVGALRGLQYHGGRILSYTVLGGVVGALGSVVSFSPLAKGILAGVAGVFMVGLGLRMLGLIPRLGWIRLPKLPRLIPPHLSAAFRNRGPLFVGLANGFMPCGPLQTMQLYALGTGSVALGALSMFLFSLGTVPLMFVFGALSRFFSARWQHRLVRASAVLVVFFGFVMAGRAIDLSGTSGQVQTALRQFLPVAPTSLAAADNGVQKVAFDLQPASYSPITVQKGIPVEWTINATEGNLNGCNGEIIIPQLNLRKKLSIGTNVIRFTPIKVGTISYTCWMGMISSTIQVVDSLGNTLPVAQASPSTLPSLGGAGGCCGSNTATAFAGGRIPTEKVAVATFSQERGERIQEVTVTVDAAGYSPAVLVVQKGVPTRIKFVGKQLSSCNNYVEFPDYGAGLDLAQGKLQTPLIPVVQDFTFQCGMSMLHGYVRVVDNLDQVDLQEVRATVTAWKPTEGSDGGCCGG